MRARDHQHGKSQLLCQLILHRYREVSAVAQERLFKDVKRTDMTHARTGESFYAFLNRSGTTFYGEVRSLLSDWLSHIPAEHRTSLRTSLRSEDDEVFESAFWELYLYEAYSQSGFALTIHPTLSESDKHPDFLVEGAGDPFYLEAVRVGKSDEDLGRDRRLDDVMAVLEAIRGSRFTVSFSYLEIGPGSISAKGLGKKITGWLETLDPEAVVANLPEHNVIESLPSWTWESDGWLLEFHALPVKPEAWEKGLSLVGMRMGQAVVVDNVSGLLRVLKRKANRYGALDYPLVIAVMSNTDIPTKDYEVSEALYGRRNASPEEAAKQPQRRVYEDGHWLTSGGWRRGHAPQVILAQGLRPTMVTRVRPRIWATLQAGVELPEQPSWLSRIDTSTYMPEILPGASLSELFELPDDWLAGEPDFSL